MFGVGGWEGTTGGGGGEVRGEGDRDRGRRRGGWEGDYIWNRSCIRRWGRDLREEYVIPASSVVWHPDDQVSKRRCWIAHWLATYLMILRVSIPQPQLGKQPVVLGVLRRPYRVGVAGFLVQLDGNGYQVPVVTDVEQAHGCWGVSPFDLWIVLSVMRDVL